MRRSMPGRIRIGHYLGAVWQSGGISETLIDCLIWPYAPFPIGNWYFKGYHFGSKSVIDHSQRWISAIVILRRSLVGARPLE
jgi:hypothetical protein